MALLWWHPISLLLIMWQGQHCLTVSESETKEYDCLPCFCFNAPVKELMHWNGWIASCDGKQLDSVPKNWRKNTGAIYLSDNNIAQISSDDLQFPELRLLVLSSNNITELPDDLLRNVSNIVYLELDNNRIENIGTEVFSDLKILNTIRGLHVTSVPDGLFMNVPHLKNLSITTEDSQIKTEFFQNLTLSSLELHIPEAESIPDNLFSTGSKSILEIFIHGEKLTSIQENIFSNLSVLEKLHIKTQNIPSLPIHIFHGVHENVDKQVDEEYGQNFKARDTFIAVKMLEDNNVPATIGLKEIIIDGIANLSSHLFRFLSNLETIKIRNANHVDGSMFNSLHRMNHLELSNSNISAIDSEWFTHLTGLQTLNLSHNHITKVNSADFTKLRLLIELDLSRNNITDLEAHVFDQFEKIRVLDLSFNSICHLPDGIFKSAGMLKRLYMQGNCIEHFPITLFYDQTALDPNGIKLLEMELEIVDLSSNQIRQFDGNIFKVGSIIVLDLKNNLISESSFTLYPGSVNVRMLDLSDNNLDCSCDLLYFLSVTIQKQEDVKSTYPLSFKGICQTPDEYQGMLIANVTLPTECIPTTSVPEPKTKETTTSKMYYWKIKPSPTKPAGIPPNDVKTRNRIETTTTVNLENNMVNGDEKDPIDVSKYVGAAVEEKLNVNAIVITGSCLTAAGLVPGIAYGIYRLRGILYKRNYNVREERTRV